MKKPLERLSWCLCVVLLASCVSQPQSPLSRAASAGYGYSDIDRSFLDHNAEASATSSSGENALDFALKRYGRYRPFHLGQVPDRDRPRSSRARALRAAG